jgi:hypothetical protein
MNLLFFDRNILEILGLQNLEEEKKKELLDKINEVAGQRVIFRIMDELSEIDKKAFDDLLARGGKEEEISQFLNSKINLPAILMEETAQFKEMLAKDAAALGEQNK